MDEMTGTDREENADSREDYIRRWERLKAIIREEILHGGTARYSLALYPGQTCPKTRTIRLQSV